MNHHGIAVVLYTRDFEPITVLELPLWAIERLNTTGGPFRLQVPDLPLAVVPPHFKPIDLYEAHFRIVTIWAEKLCWHGSHKIVLVTDDEVDALRLPLRTLPGQRQHIERYREHIRTLTAVLVRELGRNNGHGDR